MSPEPKSNTNDPILTEATLKEWHAVGLLSESAYFAALGWIKTPRCWAAWIYRLLAAFGTVFFLTGSVFFFAYNWEELGAFAKFAVIEAGIFGAALVPIVRGLDGVAGKLGALAAGVLVGVFLAVYGQVYQTGADTYELFLAWALIILPWVILTRFVGFWALWVLVGDLAVWFYGDEIIFLRSGRDALPVFYCLFVLNAGVLGLREILVWRGAKWLRARWFRLALMISALFALAIPAGRWIFSSRHEDLSFWVHAAPVCFVIFITCAFVIYRWLLPDFTVLVCVCGTLAVELVLLAADLLRRAHLGEMTLLFTMTLVTLLVFTFTGLFLGSILRAMKNEVRNA